MDGLLGERTSIAKMKSIPHLPGRLDSMEMRCFCLESGTGCVYAKDWRSQKRAGDQI